MSNKTLSDRSWKKSWKLIALTAMLAGVCFGAEVGDSLYVKSFSTTIRSGKHSFSKDLGHAFKGDKLTVTGVEDGWLKVRYVPSTPDAAPIEGYTFEDSLSPRAIAAATTGPSGNAAELSGAAAGKGLVLNADSYARDKGLTEDPFYKLMLDSHSFMHDPAFESQFDAFMQQGNLGKHHR